MVHLRLSRHLKLRHINTLLFTGIVIVNGYIIAGPLLPQVTYWWDVHHTVRQSQLRQLITRSTASALKTGQLGPNRLIIPAMILDQPTLEGSENNWFNLLYKGIWRWPGSSTPDKGGNTVFLSHRFSYTGPRGAFYYLDKLTVGDTIGVIWNGKTYSYRVTSSQIVPPTDTAIENNTTRAQITLFTCTPLWHPVNRLVVVAKLEHVS